MYKRRDWLHLHGQQAAEAGSDDSQSDDSQDDPHESDQDQEGVKENSSEGSKKDDASSSEEDEDGPPDSEDAAEEGSPHAHRLEDLSEDDFEGMPGPDSGEEDEVAEQQLIEQRKNWMQAAAKADAVKGKPLTCTACKSVLLLNAESLRQHLASKKHVRQLRACQPGVDPVRFAGHLKHSDPEVETHWERGARIGREAAKLQAAASKPKKRKRQGGGAAGAKRKGTKPGKRQRQLLREKQ